MSNTKHILIVGGGFCGSMTAVNLVRNAKAPLKITIVNSGGVFIRGVAYNAYSNSHLLNVATGNMSVFPDNMAHFTNWVHALEEYSEYENDLLSKTFLPRNLYGTYLCSIWDETISKKRKDIEVNIIDDAVIDLELTGNDSLKATLEKGSPVIANYAVLATGNSLPHNPQIANMEYYSSSTYFRNPWSLNSISNLKPDGDVLIIGNGLTMVDTVVGLIEHGFKNKIYSVSTNGFGVLPHRNFGVTYNALVQELHESYELTRLVSIVHKHIKKIRKLGISAGPVIDSLRPYSQKIWQSFSPDEKKKFLSRFRYRWGVARHRLPVFVYDIIEKLRIEGQLEVYQGRLLSINQKENETFITFHNAKKSAAQTLSVQRVINCTGPETSILKTLNPLLRKLAEKNIISCDPLELGINTDVTTYATLNVNGQKNANLFTLGTNLKGLLWESTAVPELRVQCYQLANILLKACGQA